MVFRLAARRRRGDLNRPRRRRRGYSRDGWHHQELGGAGPDVDRGWYLMVVARPIPDALDAADLGAADPDRRLDAACASSAHSGEARQIRRRLIQRQAAGRSASPGAPWEMAV